MDTHHSHDRSACGTTDSFDDHGIADGGKLVRRTYYRLAAEGYGSFEPRPEGFDRIEDAFMRAYLTTTDEYELPEHVAAAIDDAAAWTKEAFGDRPDADLRTEVLPSFYQQASAFHCRYR